MWLNSCRWLLINCRYTYLLYTSPMEELGYEMVSARPD